MKSTGISLGHQRSAGRTVAVQYHPEAAPGPHDSCYLFTDFKKMMEEWKRG